MYVLCNHVCFKIIFFRLGAATMFAATEARSCFPCFDEPHFKAIFALEVTVDQKLLVISNMPIMDSEILGQKGRILLNGVKKCRHI